VPSEVVRALDGMLSHRSRLPLVPDIEWRRCEALEDPRKNR
jgi:hypothetical protein